MWLFLFVVACLSLVEIDCHFMSMDQLQHAFDLVYFKGDKDFLIEEIKKSECILSKVMKFLNFTNYLWRDFEKMYKNQRLEMSGIIIILSKELDFLKRWKTAVFISEIKFQNMTDDSLILSDEDAAVIASYFPLTIAFFEKRKRNLLDTNARKVYRFSNHQYKILRTMFDLHPIIVRINTVISIKNIETYDFVPLELTERLNHLNEDDILFLATRPNLRNYIASSINYDQKLRQKDAMLNPMNYMPICGEETVIVSLKVWRNIRDDECTIEMLLDMYFFDVVIKDFLKKRSWTPNLSDCMKKVLSFPFAKNEYISKLPTATYFYKGQQIKDPLTILKWKHVQVDDYH